MVIYYRAGLISEKFSHLSSCNKWYLGSENFLHIKNVCKNVRNFSVIQRHNTETSGDVPFRIVFLLK